MSSGVHAKIKVAAVQATPVFLNRDATVEKACRLIEEAGREGASLVAFPEAFIPAYPDWVWAVPAGEDRVLADLYAELVANADEIVRPRSPHFCGLGDYNGSWV